MDTETGTTRYAVISLEREARDPMELARALAAVRGTPVQDQVLASKRSWGIVEEDLGADEAKALAHALREHGVTCAVGPASALAGLPAAEPATSAADLPGEGLALVAAAALTELTATTTKEKQGPGAAGKAVNAALMMTGVPLKLGGRTRTVEKTQHDPTLRFFADLLYDAPRRRVRVAATDFDFSCLGERMLQQGLGNGRLLVEDLAAATPGAWLNHGARVLVAGEPIRTMGYASLDDLEREERWLLTLRGMEGGGD